MLSLMPLLTFTLTVAYALGSYRLLLAMMDAPVGYEDDGGFHYGLAVAEPAEAEV